jgi:hypothetical protein
MEHHSVCVPRRSNGRSYLTLSFFLLVTLGMNRTTKSQGDDPLMKSQRQIGLSTTSPLSGIVCSLEEIAPKA